MFKVCSLVLCILTSSKIVNGVTDRLSQNALSINISEQFKTNQDYLDAVKVLIQSSQETQHRIAFIRKLIISNSFSSSVLDIGIGNGEISEVLCEKFNHIHLLDPSVEALNAFNEQKSKKKTIKKINCNVENYDFPYAYYDLIINAHTLYHVQRKDWKNIIFKSFKALKLNGIQLIVVNNSLGRSQLTNSMGGTNLIDIERLIEECIKINNATIQIIPLYESFKTASLEDALKIAAICLHDVNIKVPKQKLAAALIKNYKKNNLFEIDFCQYFIIIKRIK